MRSLRALNANALGNHAALFLFLQSQSQVRLKLSLALGRKTPHYYRSALRSAPGPHRSRSHHGWLLPAR